jgi:hypothetical protein
MSSVSAGRSIRRSIKPMSATPRGELPSAYRPGARWALRLAHFCREDRSRKRFNANSPWRCGLQHAAEFSLHTQVEPLPLSHAKRGQANPGQYSRVVAVQIENHIDWRAVEEVKGTPTRQSSG